MSAAVDTNILSVLWSGGALAVEVGGLLRAVRREGALVICGPVYVELHGHPGMSHHAIDEFLHETRIDIDFALSPDVWGLASRAFGDYAERRRRSGGGLPKQLLADFVIGAHAALCADRLLTLDRERYAIAFPQLRLVP